jgi:hypothetical protein
LFKNGGQLKSTYGKGGISDTLSSIGYYFSLFLLRLSARIVVAWWAKWLLKATGGCRL